MAKSKSSFFVLFFVLCIPLVGMQHSVALHDSKRPVKVTLLAGTAISLRIAGNFSVDDDLPTGQTVEFRVFKDVLMEGKVVIDNGSPAEGWIKKIKWDCEHDCTEVTIALENVRAVDGQYVPLVGVGYRLSGTCAGRSRGLWETRTITAWVMNNMDIDVSP